MYNIYLFGVCILGQLGRGFIEEFARTTIPKQNDVHLCKILLYEIAL